jgi:spermidine synthase
MASQPIPGIQADGWFREESSMWPGQALSLKVDKVLFDGQSDYQRLTIFKSSEEGKWGNVMVLDGAVQLTDRDEFVYHEMMAHVPLCAHPNPKTVLIIGGGDGGVMREVLKHEEVERCDLVDIDGLVIEQSKVHFPNVAESFFHPKANTTVGDGAAFVKGKESEYDVIIVDSSDPEGPASVLFGEEFYSNVKRCLKPGGIVCSQGESAWLHLHLIEKMTTFLRNDINFASVRYGMIYIPTYPCGSIGCLMAAKDADTDVTKPIRELPQAVQDKLKYYTPELHRGAFALPAFAKKLNQGA